MDDSQFKRFSDLYPLHPADPEEIPEPTFWPFVLSVGLLFLFWGLITSLILTGVGVVISGIAVAGWIMDLQP